MYVKRNGRLLSGFIWIRGYRPAAGYEGGKKHSGPTNTLRDC
jgi:hypothetical protein